MKASKNIQQLRESDKDFLFFKERFTIFLEDEINNNLRFWQMRLAISDVLNDFMIKYRRKNEIE